MDKTIIATDFNFPGQISKYTGKVRDVYNIENKYLVMIASDRISAFDVVLPRGIPYKGQVLNQIASRFLDATAGIVPNWKIVSPDPNVTIGRLCSPYKIEMVIRGYLAGHAWREYRAGKRELCGVPLPNGMVENQQFDEPIITPTTKASHGHDEDIAPRQVIESGLVSSDIYAKLEYYTRALFAHGSEIARERGLILVDTKYEFGHVNGEIFLMDEIHTPDSSRFFYADGYNERQKKGEPQKQLSKEFVRQWLIENGFQGKEGQKVPLMDDQRLNSISERYIELYENITGLKFIKPGDSDVKARIETNVLDALGKLP